MGKFEGVLLVSDFDDTIYTDDQRMPERNVRALEYFLGEGGLFTVATGRAYRTFAPHRHVVPINAPVVLSNGSALYDFERDKMLRQTYLPPSAREDFKAVMAQFPSLGLETYHGEDIYVWNPNPITDAHMRKVGTEYAICPIDDMPTPWTKAILQQEHPALLQVRDWFLERYGDRYEAIFSNRYYLEVTEKGSTKGGMVKYLAEQMGISPDRIYCVGDNQNDIPMMALARMAFAPSNCARPVKDWGARILCHCNDGILGDVMEILDQLY